MRGHNSGSTGRTACSNRSSWAPRSEEHTSELQSRLHLVCRLLLEKKKSARPMFLYSTTPVALMTRTKNNAKCPSTTASDRRACLDSRHLPFELMSAPVVAHI